MNKKTQKSNNVVVNFFKDYFDFYKENFRKKHIIVYVLSLVIFFIFLAMFISSIDVTTSIETLSKTAEVSKSSTIVDIFKTIGKQTLPSIFLVIFAGITPFIYLSVLGFAYPYVLALNISSTFLVNPHSYNAITMSIGAIIQIFAISLAMVAGFYYCGFSSKRFRYSQRRGFSMYDVKRQVFAMRGQEERIEKLDKEKLKKDEKMEQLNVKVPYKVLFQTFVVSLIIAIIGTIIYSI